MTDAELLTARARDFLLASTAIGYPDRDTADALAGLAGAPIDDVADLQGAYIELFDRGKQRVSLYETEYGRMRGLAKGNDLADLAGFYLAFGLTVETEDVHETPDHLGVELEFYGVLLLKQALLAERHDDAGGAIVERARRSFLADHLGRFVGAIAARPSVQADPFYGPVLAWCARLVEDECAALDVTPPPLDFFAADGERDSNECGGVRLPVIQ